VASPGVASAVEDEEDEDARGERGAEYGCDAEDVDRLLDVLFPRRAPRWTWPA
jgi:hypothetical protein